jgi:protein CpxP
MKPKGLLILLIILVLMNGVLIFMLVKKPHQNRGQKGHEGRKFLTNQLKYTERQKTKFIRLDHIHRTAMMGFDEQIRKHKDVLFNSFSNNTINIDSIALLIGKLEGIKEVEVFRFFKSVRKICTIEQQEKFDEIMNEVLKGDRKGPPRDGRVPLPPR